MGAGPGPTVGAATEAGVVLAGDRTMGRYPGPHAAMGVAKEAAKPHRETSMGRDERPQGVVNKEAAKPHRAILMCNAARSETYPGRGEQSVRITPALSPK